MNKKLFKIAICGIPVILGCITACSAIPSNCGSSSKEEFSISYTKGASKEFGDVSFWEDDDNHTKPSAGQIIADFSFAGATWCFDVTCTSKPSLTSVWTDYLSISVNNNDKKIYVTGLWPDSGHMGSGEKFSFSLYAKIGESKTNTISGFTLAWDC